MRCQPLKNQGTQYNVPDWNQPAASNREHSIYYYVRSHEILQNRGTGVSTSDHEHRSSHYHGLVYAAEQRGFNFPREDLHEFI